MILQYFKSFHFNSKFQVVVVFVVVIYLLQFVLMIGSKHVIKQIFSEFFFFNRKEKIAGSEPMLDICYINLCICSMSCFNLTVMCISSVSYLKLYFLFDEYILFFLP